VTKVVRLLPGLAVCCLLGSLALAAQGLAPILPAVAVALAAGMFARALAGEQPALDAGVTFAARSLLRLAVALMGARLSFDMVAGVGAAPVILALTGVAGTLGAGYALGRAMGLTRGLSLTASGATAICGASAALAIAATLPASERRQTETVFAVVGVTALSTIAMLIYPWATGLAGLPDALAGMFFGATIHDVAQVVGAGALVSAEATAVATYTKMLRVTLLAPVITVVAIVVTRWDAGDGNRAGGGWRAMIPPPFVIAFLVLGAATVAGLVPAPVRELASTASGLLLVIAIAALGLRTTLGGLASFGLRGVGFMVALTALIAAIGATILMVYFW
jgi:uncharacterized integral membrane protein (TIGR00698 family)